MPYDIWPTFICLPNVWPPKVGPITISILICPNFLLYFILTNVIWSTNIGPELIKHPNVGLDNNF